MAPLKNNIADFANMFKAFIGCNYLTVSFAFSQAGMAISCFLLVTIVLATEHCCNLIVKCKRLMLRQQFDRMPLTEDGEESLETSEMRAMMNKKLQMGDLGEYTFGRWGRVAVNFCLFITQFGFCTGYFIFVGTTLKECFPVHNSSIPDINASISGVAQGLPYAELDYEVDVEPQVTAMPSFQMVSGAPNLIWLVVSPLPIFIGFSLLRSVRKLGFVSIIANISIFVGCVVIFSYIVNGFSISKDFVWAKWSTAPVTAGLIVSAFEGIGTILPIEGSMVGNQHNFRRFLMGGIGSVAFILSVFGILGYLRYGAGTGQLLVQNIPDNNVLSVLVDVTLIIGVIFTFPLQQVPVVTMIETLLFARGGLLNRKDSADTEALLPEGGSIQKDLDYGSVEANGGVPEELETTSNHAETMDKYRIKAPNWQRCIVRIVVVLCELGVAIAMRFKYAYISAFTGALGSTFLAFIVPCAAHLKLAWSDLSILVKAKDIIIIVLGFLMAAFSLSVTIKEIITG